MKFIWTENNRAHIARHDIKPWLVEKIVTEGDLKRAGVNNRYIFEATIEGRHYRAVCDIATDGVTFYPVTAFPIKKRKF